MHGALLDTTDSSSRSPRPNQVPDSDLSRQFASWLIEATAVVQSTWNRGQDQGQAGAASQSAPHSKITLETFQWSLTEFATNIMTWVTRMEAQLTCVEKHNQRFKWYQDCHLWIFTKMYQYITSKDVVFTNEDEGQVRELHAQQIPKMPLKGIRAKVKTNNDSDWGSKWGRRGRRLISSIL